MSYYLRCFEYNISLKCVELFNSELLKSKIPPSSDIKIDVKFPVKYRCLKASNYY